VDWFALVPCSPITALQLQVTTPSDGAAAGTPTRAKNLSFEQHTPKHDEKRFAQDNRFDSTKWTVLRLQLLDRTGAILQFQLGS
jgi:hypothetical protein